jgi:hypothetical protein
MALGRRTFQLKGLGVKKWDDVVELGRIDSSKLVVQKRE